MRAVLKVGVDRGRRSKAATVALAKGRGHQGCFAVGHGMDEALAVNRALRAVDVSWSVGVMVAIGGVVVRRMLVAVRVASSINLIFLVLGGGHSGGALRVARVDVRGLFQVVLGSKAVVLLQFLLVLVQRIVIDICSNAAAAAAVAIASADRDGDVVDS